MEVCLKSVLCGTKCCWIWDPHHLIHEASAWGRDDQNGVGTLSELFLATIGKVLRRRHENTA